MCRKRLKGSPKSTKLLLVLGLWDGEKKPTNVAFYKRVEINPRAFQFVPLKFGGKNQTLVADPGFPTSTDVKKKNQPL